MRANGSALPALLAADGHDQRTPALRHRLPHRGRERRAFERGTRVNLVAADEAEVEGLPDGGARPG